MAIEEDKWATYFIQHAHYHGRHENLFYPIFDYFFSEKRQYFHRLYCQTIVRNLSDCYFAYRISQVLPAANKKIFKQVCQVARDIDLYLVKQYLPIMKKILC